MRCCRCCVPDGARLEEVALILYHYESKWERSKWVDFVIDRRLTE